MASSAPQFLFDKLFDFAGTVEELHPDDPLRKIGEDIGPMFTYLVDVLREPKSFPDAHINRLMRLTWRLVGNRVIPAAVMGGIPSIHFYFEKSSNTPFGMFACPTNWARECVLNRVYCMGGLVWASSMARDAWNGRFEMHVPDRAAMQKELDAIHHRAKAFESQFLHVMAQRESFKPNEYQRHVMDTYPDGVGSVSQMMYTGKPFSRLGVLDVDAS